MQVFDTYIDTFMKYIMAKAGFTRYADDTFAIVAHRIIHCLRDFPYFTDPSPSLEEIESAYADYYAKLSQAKGGGNLYRAYK